MPRLSKKDLLALKLIAGSVGVVFALAAGAYLLHSRKPLLDEHNLCPTTGEKMRVAVLVDKSDKWGRTDIARVKDLLQSVYRDVPTQGRLTIYSITGDGRKSTDVNVIFDVCNPGNEAECNSLYTNCRQIKRDYKRAFERPLQQLEASLSRPGESSFSPLLETVGAVVKDNKGESLRLHIVSDFMENHTRFRFYDVVPLDTEMIADYPLPRKSKVSVEAYFIQRRMHPMPLQKAVQSAWTGYFEKQAIPVTFKPIFATE